MWIMENVPPRAQTPPPMKGKRILLGVTGGIAAYKSPDLVRRLIERGAEVQVVMITVDPARDTPEVMQRYAAQFHPDFVGLSGTPQDIADAARSFFVGFRELAGGQFTHTDAIFLLDRQAQMRLIYRQDNVLRLAEDLQTILAQRLW